VSAAARELTGSSPDRAAGVIITRYQIAMSYNLTLDCGCLVYVACHPVTDVPHTRVIERRNTRCGIRKHDVGVRLAVWELLPERRDRVLADITGWRAEDTL
jgi:hypothetical protein